MDQITDCLKNGTCLASLSYQDGDTSNYAQSVELPILDDPLLSCTIPQYGQAVMQSVFVTAFWFTGVFAYLVIFALLVTRFEKCNKPIRADVRTTALLVGNPD